MALTPAQETANRKAAQLRKKRGRGNGKKEENQVKPLSLVEIMQKNAQHKQYKERQRHDTQRTIAEFAKKIRDTGAAVIPEDLSNYDLIVNGLKREFKGTNIRWTFTDTGVAFAAAKAIN